MFYINRLLDSAATLYSDQNVPEILSTTHSGVFIHHSLPLHKMVLIMVLTDGILTVQYLRLSVCSASCYFVHTSKVYCSHELFEFEKLRF